MSHSLLKRLGLITLAALIAPTFAQAHKAWLLPSQTVLTPNQWITVDAAVSNDLFYFNHVPLQLDKLVITAPDGSMLAPVSPHTGKYRSVFDLELKQIGTYRLAIVNKGLNASWKENGEPKRWRGTAERFAAEVPAKAQDLQVGEMHGRIETFVSAGAPSSEKLKATNSGLELIPSTHPNDLFAGESASFQFLLDGKPIVGLDVHVVPGGTRYRDQQNDVTVKTDAQGKFSTVWPSAGMYWLEAVHQDEKGSTAGIKNRRVSYVATLEVLAP